MKTSEPTTLPCDIVRDLLPLYHDGVVSETTGQAVETHLEGCPPCRQEYEDLCAELPQEAQQNSTQDKFSEMMKKLRQKRVIRTIVVALAACGLLAGLIAFLWEVPLLDVPAEDMAFSQVYRFEVDGQEKFFILFSSPVYTGYAYSKVTPSKEDPSTLVLSKKTTVFAREAQKEWRNDDWFLADADSYDTVCYGNQVLWTENANGNDIAPDYVYAFNDFYEHADLYSSFFVDMKENIIGVIYTDGHRMAWTLEGGLVADDYPNQDGNYPDLP